MKQAQVLTSRALSRTLAANGGANGGAKISLVAMLKRAKCTDRQRMDDPWTYFGSYSRTEADDAAGLLREAGVTFEIIEDEKKAAYPTGGWSGPFAIWIRDEHSAKASAILVPHFLKAK